MLRISGGAVTPNRREHSQDVTRSNQDSARASARDGFARLVENQLQGGVAAILTPERRRLLVAGATQKGLTPFEANLVIAMVQNDVRRPISNPRSLQGTVQSSEFPWTTLWQVLAAAALGLAFFVAGRMLLLG